MYQFSEGIVKVDLNSDITSHSLLCSSDIYWRTLSLQGFYFYTNSKILAHLLFVTTL